MKNKKRHFIWSECRRGFYLFADNGIADWSDEEVTNDTDQSQLSIFRSRCLIGQLLLKTLRHLLQIKCLFFVLHFISNLEREVTPNIWLSYVRTVYSINSKFSPANGVVSLEINPLTEMDMGRYTASFTTPLGMFDTKVHYDFTGSGKYFNPTFRIIGQIA